MNFEIINRSLWTKQIVTKVIEKGLISAKQ